MLACLDVCYGTSNPIHEDDLRNVTVENSSSAAVDHPVIKLKDHCNEIDLNDNGKLLITLKNNYILLDIRDKNNCQGTTTNTRDLKEKLISWMNSKDIDPKSITNVAVKNLDSNNLSFLSIFEKIVCIDLRNSRTYNGIWKIDFSLGNNFFANLKLLILLGNHVGHGRGKALSFVQQLPANLLIVLSKEDHNVVLDPSYGLGSFESWSMCQTKDNKRYFTYRTRYEHEVMRVLPELMNRLLFCSKDN
jgi:hypothetical protein